MNISTNPKYKAYIDVGSIGLELNENISYSEDALVLMIKEEEKLEGKGRILLRPSGTEPLVRVMVEAQTKKQCEEVANIIVNKIKELR